MKIKQTIIKCMFIKMKDIYLLRKHINSKDMITEQCLRISCIRFQYYEIKDIFSSLLLLRKYN